MLVSILIGRLGIADAISCGLLLCGLSGQPQLGIPDEAREAWLALLHYDVTSNGWLSQVSDPSFFLDPRGKHDPEAEWNSDRLAFLAPAGERPVGEHGQCRFPARFALMKQALAWSSADVRQVECVELETHRRSVDAESLSVVFASYFLANPASAFGHIMLYLGSGSGRKAVLGDYSVSFEANTSGLSPWAYIPRGLTGGLIARYRLAPFHERIRKYEIEEQRDLWVFPLQVSQEEIDQLVLHLWELKDVIFEYGFLGENCAQKILRLVHAVAPRYDVLPHRTLAALPFEVSRHLVERIGLAGEPTRRPSLSTQFNRLVAELSPEETKELEVMVSSRIVPIDASSVTLMAALLWSESRTPDRAFRRAAEEVDHRDLMWWRELWASQVTAVTDADHSGIARPRAEPDRSLLSSHRPSRFTVRGGYRRGVGSILNLGARWLLHDAVDPRIGYPPASAIEVGRLEVVASAEGNLLLDEATVLRVEKLASASDLQSPLAWRVDIGARRLPLGEETPLHIGLEVAVGGGATLARDGYSATVYSMGGVRPGVSLARRGTTFSSVGVWSSGLLLLLPGDLRARISGEYILSHRLAGAIGFDAVLRKGLDSAWDLELTFSESPDRAQVSFGLVSFR